jgi:putative acetyltransferase
VALLDALVAAGDRVPALSLVAVTNGEVVGHVACSEATVDVHRVVALGPIGVLPSLGIEPPEPAWREHFQVRPLSAYDPRIRGRFRYAAAFTAV